MITIYAERSYAATVNEIVDSVPRLSELVAVVETSVSDHRTPDLLVDDRGISAPLTWDNAAPPYLRMSPVPLRSATLLGMIFDRLDNLESVQHHLAAHPELAADLTSRYHLQYQLPLTDELAESLVTYRGKDAYRYDHNIALLQQYGLWPGPVTLRQVEERYRRALDAAPDSEHYVFTLKQYATLLLDTQQGAAAEEALEALDQPVSEAASFALKTVLINAWMARLSVPYDQDMLTRLKEVLGATLDYYEQQPQKAEAGLLLIQASEVANISESYAESLGYINRALDIFRAEGLPELSGSSLLRKGVLLYTWAQRGNPQFYKPAIDTYQEALKLFKRDEAPDIFAQIHLHLGVLYAEMSALQQKKSIWAAVSATSFQEALRYYTPEEFPYEYGLSCNNYANALTKYPTALRSDNYEKALEYYREALKVRTATYPYERALTLLNYLEASWHVGNDEEFNQSRYQDMLGKAREVKSLVDSPELLTEADRHLEQLAWLAREVNSEGYA